MTQLHCQPFDGQRRSYDPRNHTRAKMLVVVRTRTRERDVPDAESLCFVGEIEACGSDDDSRREFLEVQRKRHVSRDPRG